MLETLRMTSSYEPAVLITGASAGIGAGLAREFARRGMRVALVARRVEQLEVLAAELNSAGGTASAHRGDVTVDGDLAGVIEELAARQVVPVIVVANAGFGVVGRAQSLELADYRRQFETNMFGVIRTLHETIGALRRTRGRFVIMGSVAGYISVPGGSAYAMSKFAVRALAESLHGDLKVEGVGCTLLSPGFVDSDIRRTDNRGGLHADVEDPIPGWLRMKTGAAAKIMVDGILRGKREVIVTFHGKLMVFIARHFPRFTRWLLVRRNRGLRSEPK
jgi:short-subunit dehydrogenase